MGNFKVWVKISFQLLSFNNKNFYLCTRTIILLFHLSQLDVFFHDIGQGSLRRAEYGGVT